MAADDPNNPTPGRSDIPFSAPRREGKDEKSPSATSAREEREMPTFFSQSREERAEQARRAALRVRRRGQPSSDAARPTRPIETPEAPKEAPERPVTGSPKPAPAQTSSPDVKSDAPVSRRPMTESASDSIFRAWEAKAEAAKPAVETRATPVQRPEPVQRSESVQRPPSAKQSEPVEPATPVQREKKPEPVAKPAQQPPRTSNTESVVARASRATAEATQPSRRKPEPPRQEAPARAPTVPRPKSPPKPPGAQPRRIEPTIQTDPRPAVTSPEQPSIVKPGARKPDAVEPKAQTPAPAAKSSPASPGMDEIISRTQNKLPTKHTKAADIETAPNAAGQRIPPPQPAAPTQAPPTESAASLRAKALPPPTIAPQPTIPAVATKRFAAFEWMIASRYLRARKKEGFVSVIAGFSLVGIMLGVATLIVVMAVMTGFRETLIDQILGVNAHLNVVSQTEKFENYDPLAKAIREVDGVTRVSPVVEGQVLATGSRGHSGVVVRGVRKEDLVQLNVVKSPEASSGSVDDFADDNGVAIGANLAAKLGLRVGDYITLISPDGDITPFSATPMPRKKEYEILYVFKLGLYEYDSVFVYMPLSEAQIYFNKKGTVDSLEVITEDPNEVESYINPIRHAARQSVGVYTWKDMNGSLIGALDIERKVMFVILTMIILVAALNIISGLVMLVKDKGRDVAILRTMGMARGSILRIFFICGASIGVIGSIAGVILGVLFALNIGTVQAVVEKITGSSLWDPSVRMLSEIPSKLEFSDVALTLFIALALSFIATLYPAWKASKLDPVEALRYE